MRFCCTVQISCCALKHSAVIGLYSMLCMLVSKSEGECRNDNVKKCRNMEGMSTPMLNSYTGNHIVKGLVATI